MKRKLKAQRTLLAQDPIEWIGSKVEARMVCEKGARFRITLWGEDDLGVAMDGLDPDVARKVWKRIPDIISLPKALALGFKRDV